MQRVKLDTDIRPLSDFRANVASIIDEIRNTKRPLIITQHGKSAAVMLDVTEYESMMDKIELLSEINIAETEIQNGKGINHKDVKNMIYKRAKR
ncbi:type II toxin-antitoxin system Phd/YefM family antitoxin [candidate division KSB1 bacterium]|nr:type II toxin-antitoxin system Phd/YefM family antitoxin [candidate division KSB1 bacterium]